MLVDRSLDALDAVDPLNVEERAQAVLALHRIEQIAIARTAGEPFVKFGVYRIMFDRHRVAPAQLAKGQMLVAAAIEPRSEEHTSELQSLMRISYAVFCLKKKKRYKRHIKLSTA